MKWSRSGRKAVIRQSHPARGAWIEVVKVAQVFTAMFVAPRKGCVD